MKHFNQPLDFRYFFLGHPVQNSNLSTGTGASKEIVQDDVANVEDEPANFENEEHEDEADHDNVDQNEADEVDGTEADDDDNGDGQFIHESLLSNGLLNMSINSL